MEKNILSFREALGYLDVSKSFLYKLTSNRGIRFSKPNNGKIYFRKSDLDAYMLSNVQKSAIEVEEDILTKLRQNGKSR